jgi:dTDP-4-dehydrorhamnose reductase
MFITGASGFLGRHLVLASEPGEWELLTPASRVLDVRERARVHEEITAWRPNVVVHLAYRTDEWRTIVDGSRNVAVAAAEAGARLIHMSTDLVFAGRALPYTEADPPDATMQYGRWKAEAEAEVVAACPSALVVRSSLMYGTDILSPQQCDVEAVLAGHRHMSFFTDEFRCPAHAADIAAALVRLAEMPAVTGVLHVAGPRAVSRAELAQAFAHQLGGANAAPLPTASLAESGLDRPGHLVLDTAKAAALGITCRELHAAL